MKLETVYVEGDGPIRHLVLNRPRIHNAVNAQLIADLTENYRPDTIELEALDFGLKLPGDMSKLGFLDTMAAGELRDPVEPRLDELEALGIGLEPVAVSNEVGRDLLELDLGAREALGDFGKAKAYFNYVIENSTEGFWVSFARLRILDIESGAHVASSP